MSIILSSAQGENKKVCVSNRRQKYPSHTCGHWFREVLPSPHQGSVTCWALQPCTKEPTALFFFERRSAESAERHPHRFSLPRFFQDTLELQFTLLLGISCSASLAPPLQMTQHTFCEKWYTLHFIVHTRIKTRGFILHNAGSPLLVFIRTVHLKSTIYVTGWVPVHVWNSGVKLSADMQWSSLKYQIWYGKKYRYVLKLLLLKIYNSLALSLSFSV